MSAPIDHDTIAKIERDLSDNLSAMTSCAPNPSAAPMSEADWDTAGMAIAKIMMTCAEYLEEAGFDTADAMAIAERAQAEYSRLVKARIQRCPGCGVMPGEGMDEDCEGDLECNGGEPNQ